jgi:hypothetical protein
VRSWSKVRSAARFSTSLTAEIAMIERIEGSNGRQGLGERAVAGQEISPPPGGSAPHDHP